MYERKQSVITVMKKKVTIVAFTVAQTINMKRRYLSAEEKGDEVALLELMIEMVLGGVVKPKMTRAKLEAMSEDDLITLCKAVIVGNGFAPGEAPKRKKKKS